MVALGLTAGAFTLFWLGSLNASAGYWDFFWPQFFQGLGLSCVFVPLTTISMDRIAREKMGNATSLFNLMRNLGGSIGIAVTGTMLSRQQQAYVNVFGANVDVYSPQTQSRFEQMRAGFVAAGADITTATQRAYAALFGVVQQQAYMVSFVLLFRMLGVMFLLLLPLILLMKRPRGSGGAMGAH
jgi:DHA2 family multidrug resistance protein